MGKVIHNCCNMCIHDLLDMYCPHPSGLSPQASGIATYQANPSYIYTCYKAEEKAKSA